MPSPFFSIVTASYNSESTIRDNVRSVLHNLVMILASADNNSTDKTLEVCKSSIRSLTWKAN